MSDSAVDDVVTNLVLAAGRGDRAAANSLIRDTQRDVWRFLGYLVGNAAAEELTTETFVRALGTAHRFTGHGTARTWLLTIARQVAADHAADHAATTQARPRIVTEQDWPGAGAGMDDTAAITRAVRTLAADRRDAFVLTQVLGLDYAAAAAVCECPVADIRSRVANARQDLVTALAPGFRRSPAGRR